MRGQKRKVWTASLPTPSGDKLAIAGILPDSSLARAALNLVPRQHRGDDGLAAKTATEAQLMLCIKRIGDKELNYDKLSSGGLDRYLDTKQIVLVKRLFTHLTQPSDAEVEAFIDSIGLERVGSDWRWTGRVVVGDELRRLLDARDDVERLSILTADAEGDVEALAAVEGEQGDKLARELETMRRELEKLREDLAAAEEEHAAASEAGFSISGIMPNSRATKMAVEQIPKKFRDYGLGATKEAQENLIRLTVRTIDGKDVNQSDLKGDGLDDWLSAKEQHLVVLALSQTTVPGEEETEDFLASIEVG